MCNKECNQKRTCIMGNGCLHEDEPAVGIDDFFALADKVVEDAAKELEQEKRKPHGNEALTRARNVNL